MSQKINFEVESGEIIDDPSQSEFATARLRLFSSGENRHGMYCEESVLVATSDTAYEKPVIFEIVNGDFGSHSPNSQIAGFIVPGSSKFIREDDGRLGLYVLSKIWKRYSGKFVDIFVNKNKNKSKLSVEMIMDETETREDGLIGMKKFYYTAASILGSLVSEASPGANIEMLSFSEDYDDAYKKEFGYDKYKDLDFQIPEEVKKSTKLGIEKHSVSGKGGNSVSLANAKFIQKEVKSTPDKIRRMYKKLSYYAKLSLESEEEKVRFELWGGKAGLEWSKKLFEKIEEIDNKKSSYFVYKNIGEANPSIRGIEPSVSVSQANEIASQAEAIGITEEKNGWAIAISNFKKTHEVEDDKWVKERKEELSVKKKEDFEEKPEVEEPTEDMAVEQPPVEDEKPEEDKPTEDMAVEPEAEVEEPKTEMSLDSYLDLAYLLELLERVTEDEAEYIGEEGSFAVQYAVDEIKKEEGEKSFAVLSKGMFAKMKSFAMKMEKMEESNKAYMAEFAELKKFKESIEAQKFSYEIESTLKEVEKVMPSDEIEKARVESVNFSLETVEQWKNAVKAKAFTFSGNAEKKDKTNVVPRWSFNVEVSQAKESLWKK